MKVLMLSANTEKINMPVLPLGLACVAESARNAGHDVALIDLMGQQDTCTVLKEAIYGFQPEIIGISVRNIDDQYMQNPGFLLDPVKDIVSDCRSFSDVPIILGGAGYSIFPESALAYLGADMGIQGEGEIAFNALLERLHRKTDPSGTPGLYLPDRGIQGRVRFTKNLDEFPLPLPDTRQWTCLPDQNEDIWLPFQTRRGCPMNCTYCSTATIEGKILRKHSPVQVVDAVSRFVEAGFNRFFFVDNTFNLPSSYAKELCDGLIKAGLNISWRCIVYPWKMDEELVKKMAEAGCKEVSLGFESGSERMIRLMNKQFTLDDIRLASALLKQHNIHRMGFLLLGGPGETKESVEESLAFADSLELEAVKLNIGIRIYPHTMLAQTALKEGLISSEMDLLHPRFYLAKDLDDWLYGRVEEYLANHPNWML